jgi:hypothetical protein
MKLGEFRKSVEGMMEQAGLSIGKAKKCKLRIVQHVYNGDLEHIRIDEKEIVGIELEPDKGEIIFTVADKGEL